MTISEASKQYGVSEDTLRYYEKIGLVTSHRRPSGIRTYEEDDIARLEFVKCMRSAGMEIESLKRYMELLKKGDSTILERKQLLIEERAKLQEKKNAIETSLKRLDYKIENYEKLFSKGKKQ
jgi:DNA-binding transcriptional MerR regulator